MSLTENIKRGEGTKEYQRHIGTFDNGMFLRYKDSLGYWTIGYGHLIKPNESYTRITEDKAEEFLMMDIEQAKRGAIAIHGPMFHKVSPRIQNLLIEMVFQLGEDTARTFRRFNAALAEGDYDQAARELVSSRWYKQTPNRVKGHIDTLIKALLPKSASKS
ncbi:glycoside hydrolase family protein [Aeromonas salmonicida]|uniref:glycoside hydrolase family protein n=1 Tax=Aeromonas salmonicida TaxID=645 RepID=UPI001119504B|nr:glycoside hydrolase family protein [Aeromonas salmonicida]TNI73079.1 autolysin [Aeromonas salmonicida]